MGTSFQNMVKDRVARGENEVNEIFLYEGFDLQVVYRCCYL